MQLGSARLGDFAIRTDETSQIERLGLRFTFTSSPRAAVPDVTTQKWMRRGVDTSLSTSPCGGRGEQEHRKGSKLDPVRCRNGFGQRGHGWSFLRTAVPEGIHMHRRIKNAMSNTGK
jgi:hypothetical protein